MNLASDALSISIISTRRKPLLNEKLRFGKDVAKVVANV